MIGVARQILNSMLMDLQSKLTHEVLITFIAEVSAIMNARPLLPVSMDSESPFVLCPATLLTMKTDQSVKSFPTNEFNVKDLYKSQWQQVQYLANSFWDRWKKEYVHHLQGRRKWKEIQPNLHSGDVVLLKEKTLHRNSWPMGIVSETFSSSDGLVRKVKLRIVRDGQTFTYMRPVTEIVPLICNNE